MSEVLSADDIDALLSAVRGRDGEPREQLHPDRSKLYDWKRPLYYSRENLRILSHIHEQWNRLCSLSLSRHTGTQVQVRVASLDQLTWEEFIRSIPNPSLITTITMEPMKGSAVLQFDPAIAFPLVERLLGGEGERVGRVREMTLIEQNLMESVTVGLLGNLREAWSGLLDLRPRLASIETQPHLVHLVNPNESVALVTSQVRIGDDVEGMMNFCLPWPTAAQVANKLTDAVWQGRPQHDPLADDLKTVLSHLLSRPVTIEGDFDWEGPPMTLQQLDQVKQWKGQTLKGARYHV